MSEAVTILVNILILIFVVGIQIFALSRIPSEYRDLLKEVVQDVKGTDNGNPVKSAAILAAILAMLIVLSVTITKQTIAFLRSVIIPNVEAAVSVNGQLLLMGIFLFVFVLSLGSHHFERTNEKMGRLEEDLAGVDEGQT